jgi:hypothetical protein
MSLPSFTRTAGGAAPPATQEPGAALPRPRHPMLPAGQKTRRRRVAGAAPAPSTGAFPGRGAGAAHAGLRPAPSRAPRQPRSHPGSRPPPRPDGWVGQAARCERRRKARAMRKQNPMHQRRYCMARHRRSGRRPLRGTIPRQDPMHLFANHLARHANCRGDGNTPAP